MVCPGSKIKSKGEGKGLGYGETKGPIGIPTKKDRGGISLSLVTLGEITRLLRTVKNLKSKVYVVGGVVTEGQTMRDLDIVINSVKDIPILKKALGKYASRAHFILQKGEPPATLFVKITGDDPLSPDLPKKGEKIQKHEYANRI